MARCQFDDTLCPLDMCVLQCVYYNLFSTFHYDFVILKSNKHFLVGGFNPFEKYLSNWIISRGRDENKEYLKL